MENFFNNYTSKYFFLPIYFLINIFKEINSEYVNYIKLLYADNIDNEKQHELFFIMPKQFNCLEDINCDSRFFIKEYTSVKTNQINTNEPNVDNKLHAIKYIITLRKDTIYFRLLNFYNYNFIPNTLGELIEDKIFNSKICNYTIYKFNLETKQIQIHLIPHESYKKIKQIIFNNYIVISNILALNSEYKEITWDNYNYEYNNLFNKWIEPIEPSDNMGYKKLTILKMNEEKIMVNNEIYTDILCFRNFIQLDYSNGLRLLYSNDPDKHLVMPILYTTYRIDNTGNILTILH